MIPPFFMAKNRQSFIVALKRESQTDHRAHLYLEGPGSLEVRSQDEFYFKLLRFFDDLDRLKFIDHIVFSPFGVESSDIPKWRAYVETGKRALRDLRSSLGSGDDSLMGLRNIMANLEAIVSLPSSDLIQVSKPFHAVVVAAGPSLDLEIEKLRSIQKNVLIIAVDAVLRTLLDKGIHPHLVCCTERGVETLPFFSNIPKNIKTILVGQGTVHPDVFKIYPGPKSVSFKFSSNFLWLPMKRKHHWIGGSVAHLCYRLAASMGAQSIALVGQDLAYHPETLQSHGNVVAYPGWSEGDTFENRRSEFHASYVEGNWLKQVPSNPMWGTFASEYAEMISDAKIPTFNTSKYGRKILGAKPMSFEEWIRGIARPSVQVEIPTENSEKTQDREALREKLDDALNRLGELRQKIVSGETDSSLYQVLLQYPHFLELVMEVVITDYVKAENARWGFQDLGAEREFLDAVAARLQEILSILDDARHKI